MTSIFDTHAHYDDSAFDTDRDDLLSSLPKKGVCGVINCGVDIASSKQSLSFSKKYPFFYAAVGYHPENLPDDGLFDRKSLESFLENEKTVAIGEIGLDYHWRTDNIDLQKHFFAEQMKLANEHSLPVIIHSRDAAADTLDLVRQYNPTGVLHCFSGSLEIAKEYLKLGMYLGFGGAITFKNAKRAREILKEVPIDRILLETDCPYMAPEPFRGKRNHSGLILHIAEVIADIKGISTEQVCNITTQSAINFFGLSE